MNSSACSAVICQPGGHEQNHDRGIICRQYNKASDIVIRGIITVLSEALSGGIIKMTFPESRVFVLVNILFFLNNQH